MKKLEVEEKAEEKSSVIDLTDKNYKAKIAKGFAVLDFNAEWCGPCRQMKKPFEALAVFYPSIVFGSVDIDKEEKAAVAFDVASIPLFVITRDGIEIDRKVGSSSAKAFAAWVKKALEG